LSLGFGFWGLGFGVGGSGLGLKISGLGFRRDSPHIGIVDFDTHGF